MAKRKLNKQQKSRIADNHSALVEASQNEAMLQGLVVSHFGKEVELVTCNQQGAVSNWQPIRCHFRAKLPTIVCGDRVIWQPATDSSHSGVIEALLERESLLCRPRPYQDPKPVAANIDCIYVVFAAEPEPITSLIDRCLIAAENAGIKAALLINKTDLLPSFSESELNHECSADITQATKLDSGNEEIDALYALYRSLGYPVYCHSSLDYTDNTQENILLKQALVGESAILVGQSGVGKSSIINSLVGQARAKIGQISDANDKGRHTTTTSHLYPIDLGTESSNSNVGGEKNIAANSIIDSPGIREFGLWHLTHNDIINGLPEFREYALQCKFRDCEHGVSFGCALQEAMDAQRIHSTRIASYQHILNAME